jgi:hypothetical protein
MYISKNNLLTKKVNRKNISVKILAEKISKEDIYNLTKKEFDYISQLDSYKNFEKNIYNKNILKDVVFNSKLFYNQLDAEKKDKLKIFYDLNFIQKFVYESNRAE